MNSEEPNLKGHLEDLRRKTGIPEGGLSSVVYCGRMRNEGDTTDTLGAHRDIVEAEVNSEGSNVTGLLIGQGTSVMHFIEGPSQAVLRILGKLRNHSQFAVGTDGTTMQEGRVVYSVEDCPKRNFTEWYSGVLPEKKSQVDDLTAESCAELVNGIAVGLFDMGERLKTAGDDVDISSYADLLPGKAVILALCGSSLFCSLADYSKTYVEPFHLDLESERSWPLERMIIY
jgi:hypothetical protein